MSSKRYTQDSEGNWSPSYNAGIGGGASVQDGVVAGENTDILPYRAICPSRGDWMQWVGFRNPLYTSAN